jgi:hypothetical protein
VLIASPSDIKELTMRASFANNKGIAMVVALAFIFGLSVIATIIVAVATSEKKSAFNDYTYSRSFYSADAGGEAAINWLRIQNSPPGLLDTLKHVYVPSGYSSIASDHKYKHDVRYIRKKLRPGWSHHYKDFEYTINAEGASVQDSESQVEVQALRLFKEGYQ